MNSNTIEDVKAKADVCKICDKMEYIKSYSYTSTSEYIFSNGTYDSSINSDGYINITNVNGEYIVFLGSSNKICVYIYRYASNKAISEVLLDIEDLREITGRAEEKYPPKTELAETDAKDINNNLIDINNFRCPNCKRSTKFRRSGECIVATCRICDVDYILAPSRYYVLYAVKKKYKTKYDRGVPFE